MYIVNLYTIMLSALLCMINVKAMDDCKAPGTLKHSWWALSDTFSEPSVMVPIVATIGTAVGAYCSDSFRNSPVVRVLLPVSTAFATLLAGSTFLGACKQEKKRQKASVDAYNKNDTRISLPNVVFFRGEKNRLASSSSCFSNKLSSFIVSYGDSPDIECIERVPNHLRINQASTRDLKNAYRFRNRASVDVRVLIAMQNWSSLDNSIKSSLQFGTTICCKRNTAIYEQLKRLPFVEIIFYALADDISSMWQMVADRRILKHSLEIKEQDYEELINFADNLKKGMQEWLPHWKVAFFNQFLENSKSWEADRWQSTAQRILKKMVVEDRDTCIDALKRVYKVARDNKDKLHLHGTVNWKKATFNPIIGTLFGSELKDKIKKKSERLQHRLVRTILMNCFAQNNATNHCEWKDLETFLIKAINDFLEEATSDQRVNDLKFIVTSFVSNLQKEAIDILQVKKNWMRAIEETKNMHFFIKRGFYLLTIS